MARGELSPAAAGGRLPWLVAAAALVLAGWALWRAFGPAAYGDPVATSVTMLKREDRLVVFSAELAPVVAAADARLLGMLNSRQVAVIPARADYALNLAALSARAMAWDRAGRRLTVTLPPLEISPPDLDEGRAQYLREGVWITADAEAHLTHDNTLAAQREAAKAARNPVLLALARDAARAAIVQNLSLPLNLAGYGPVTVTAQFAGEKDAPQ